MPHSSLFTHQGIRLHLSPQQRFQIIAITIPLFIRYRRGGFSTEQQDQFAARMRAHNLPEDHIRLLIILIGTVAKVLADQEHAYRFDRYLGGGCAVLDLVLFQILASSGLADIPLHIAWLAFVCSLPCTAGFLAFCFVRPPTSKNRYGVIHLYLSFLSVVGAFIATDAYIWHLWDVAGIIFLTLSLLVGLLSFGYATLVLLATHLRSELSTDPTFTTPDPDQPETLYG
ncbi:hypothetical protein [Dictyobacter kobayashii]|uniref:Uncharacterized protein n=1 Tax=Dictyobacter kobayashii TaxID=2014872 RepID=A0A402ASD2_9CHLR|nr:hypothetical protein [Dictyobacter kobayashii]GCE22028.1 hypothetical protein KDK_58280 [Dictyobacter kobayashii]